MDRGFGLCAFEFNFSVAHGPRIVRSTLLGVPEALAELYPVVFRSLAPDVKMRPFLTNPCTTASEMTGERRAFKDNALMRQYAQRFGMYDSMWVTAAEPSGWGCGLHAGRPKITTLSARTAAQWTMLGAHLSAALRLRRKLRSCAARADEAAFFPNGTPSHATGRARENRVLSKLRQSVLQLEQLRTQANVGDQSAALRAWTVLVDARWTLVDQFERDGQRFVVARENEPSPPNIEVLTPRERQIVGYAALGHDNKVIAYDLGISHSTVRVLLARAAAKLHAETREQMLHAYNDACERAQAQPMPEQQEKPELVAPQPTS